MHSMRWKGSNRVWWNLLSIALREIRPFALGVATQLFRYLQWKNKLSKHPPIIDCETSAIGMPRHDMLMIVILKFHQNSVKPNRESFMIIEHGRHLVYMNSIAYNLLALRNHRRFGRRSPANVSPDEILRKWFWKKYLLYTGYRVLSLAFTSND